MSLGVLVVVIVSSALAGRWHGVVGHAVAGVHAVSGLALLFFFPGILFVPWVWRRPRPPLSAVLGSAFAANLVIFVVVTTAIKCLGGTVTSGSFLAAVAAVSLLAAAGSYRRFRTWTIVNDFAGIGFDVALGTVLLLVFVGITSAPLLPSEHDYFTGHDAWHRLGSMVVTPVDMAGRGASYTFEHGWHRAGEHRYEFMGQSAAIAFRNSGDRFTFRFSAVVQNYEPFDVCAHFIHDGEDIASTIAPARFLRGRHWDSRQSNNAMVSASLVLPPGQTTLVVELSRADGRPHAQPYRTLLHDFSNLDGSTLHERFSRCFVITRADDFRQHVSLARSLAVSMLPMGNNGHYFIVDFPLHYFFNMSALALLGDRVESLWLAHLAKMVLVLAMLVRLPLSHVNAEAWLKRMGNRLLVLVPAAAMLMNLSKFLPIGEGAVYHDGTIVMLLTAVVLFTAEKQWLLVTVFACLAGLTQRPTIFFVGAYLAAGVLIGPHRKPLVRCLVGYAAFMSLLALGIFAAGHVTGEWAYWQRSLAYEDTRKLTLVREALRIPGETIPYMLERTWALWLLILAGTGFLPLAMLAGCGRLSACLLCTTLLYLLPISLAPVHRIHYAALPVVMLTAAGALAVAGWRQKLRTLLCPLVVASSVACVAYIAPASSDWELRFGDRVLYASLPHMAIADGLMARGTRRAQRGENAAAIRDFRRAAMESPRHRAQAYAQIASVRDEQGRPDQASQWREKARALLGD